MKKIIFSGFFRIKPSVAKHYIEFFQNLGHKVDFEPYTISDVLIRRKHACIRNNFIPKSSHYDVMYCISGGCLHMLNLIPKITVDKIIFDSGPYLCSSKHIEHFIQNKYHVPFPLEQTINNTYRFFKFGSISDANTEYCETILKPLRPQLILTSKKDQIIDQNFIRSYAKDKKNIEHIEFNDGIHANIYKYNKEQYTAIVNQFIKN
jgi:hypothetical protein